MNEIISIINSKDDYYNKISNLLYLAVIPNKLKVEFALYCAKDYFKYIDANKYPELATKTAKCLELVADYLLGKTVSKKDLYAAAAAAAYAAYAVAKEQKLQELHNHLLNMIIKELKLDKIFKILYVA